MRFLSLCIALLFFLMGFFSISAQSWQDSYPFQNSYGENGVILDTVAMLEPVFQTIQHELTDEFKLDGIEWVFPFQEFDLNSAVDIDNISLEIDDTTNSTYMITDQQANRIIVYDRFANQIIRDLDLDQFAYFNPNDADFMTADGRERYLIPFSVEDHVILVNHINRIIWEYGENNELESPADAVFGKNMNEYLIADKGHDRVIIVNDQKEIVWEIRGDTLNNPVDVEYIAATDSNQIDEILITDQGNNRVLVVARDSKNIVWEFGGDSLQEEKMRLNLPTDADVLDNGHIIIADAGNQRIIEVDREGTYFWEFTNPVSGLEDVDVEVSDNLLVIKEFIPDSTQPSLTKKLPGILGFSTVIKSSHVYSVDKRVNFRQLLWQSDTLGQTTSVKLQFRSSADYFNEKDIYPAWRGPSGDSTSYYLDSGSRISDMHRGHRYYQVRARMGTENPRKAPTLSQLWVRYFFYDSDRVPAPRIYSSQIPESTLIENMSVNWKRFEYHQLLPADPAERDKVRFSFQITDDETDEVLISDIPWRPESDVSIDLSQYDALKGVKQVHLNAFPYTTAQYLTPQLVSWKIVYELFQSTKSNIQFVGPDRYAVDSYTGTASLPPENESENPGRVYIMLDDRNLEQSQSFVNVPLQSLSSGDTEETTLSLTAPFQAFSLVDPVPIRIIAASQSTRPGNDTLEVYDRDLLTVFYQDPTDPNDVSSDTVIVIMGTKGEIIIEDSNGKEFTAVNVGDSIFVRLTGEHDKNLNVQGPDSLKVVLSNSVINDSEYLQLYEVKNDDGIENTGEFLSKCGILLDDDKNWATDDRVLFARPGDVIRVVYTDNYTVVKSVQLPEQKPVDDNFDDIAYKLQVAPNPFYENKNENFRLRLFSTLGNLTLEKLEIYNLAGQLVRKIEGDEIFFSNASGRTIVKNRYGIIENWWDLQNDSGEKTSSGTYWVKFTGKLENENTGSASQVSAFTKFVMIR